MKNTIENLTNELVETAQATGYALMDTAGAAAMATMHTTQLAAKATYITVDTLDYGLKATIDAMPEDAEDLVNRGAVLFAAVAYDVDKGEK